jgi:hypothetical protein
VAARVQPFGVGVVALVVGVAFASAGLGACSSFSGDGGSSGGADGAAAADDAAASDARDETSPPSTTPTRCGDSVSCPAASKCCLPLDDSAASCVAPATPCGAAHGELLCSSAAGCSAGQVCCVNAERNAGQTEFDILTSYCVAANACPDQDLQRRLCDLGSSNQCAPGLSCKPYKTDTENGEQKPVNPLGYATCQ